MLIANQTLILLRWLDEVGNPETGFIKYKHPFLVLAQTNKLVTTDCYLTSETKQLIENLKDADKKGYLSERTPVTTDWYDGLLLLYMLLPKESRVVFNNEILLRGGDTFISRCRQVMVSELPLFLDSYVSEAQIANANNLLKEVNPIGYRRDSFLVPGIIVYEDAFHRQYALSEFYYDLLFTYTLFKYSILRTFIHFNPDPYFICLGHKYARNSPDNIKAIIARCDIIE